MSPRLSPPLLAVLWALSLPTVAGPLMDALSPEEHHLRYCEAAAEMEWEKNAPEAAIQVWHDCFQEAEHRGYKALSPILRGNLIVAQTRRDYGRREAADPLLYSRIVLATVAQNTDATFPVDLVDKHWHRLMTDPATRQNMSSVQTVTLRWLNKSEIDPVTYGLLEQNLRRHVGDMGFKVSLPDTAQAGEAKIMVMLEGGIHTGEPVVEGTLTYTAVDSTLESMPVKFKERRTRGAPVKATYQARSIRPEEAHAEVLENVTLLFALQFQHRVVTEVFRNYEIPAP